MSNPTIIMVSHAADDDGIDRLNVSIVDRLGTYGRLTRVDRVAPGWDATTAVHIGSFNHLDEPTFMRSVHDAGWRQPARLQVFIRRQDDASVTEYDLFDGIRPRQIARQAVGRGVGLSAPPPQVDFFDRLRSALQRSEPVLSWAAEEASAWLFEVVVIHPSFGFAGNARVVAYGQGTALDHDGFSVSPVDLAFAGIGVRWGSHLVDVQDYVDKVAVAAISTLNPGDRVRVTGRLRPGPQGIAELSDVRSVVRLT